MQSFFGFSPVDDPYPLYTRLRAAGPAVQINPGVWAVGRYDDVLFVLKNHQLFSSSILGGGFGFGARTVIGTDPPDHTRLRNIVNRAFTPKMVAAMEPRIREIASDLISDILTRNGEFDLIEDFAVPLPVIVISEILGIDAERRDDFKRWSDSFVFSGVGSGMAASDNARAEFRDYFSGVIEARRQEPKDDLISALTRAEGEETLSPEEVFAFTVLLLIAGNETTTNLIGNAVVALLGHPGQLARAIEGPAYGANLVEESLRWDSPVQTIMRITTRPVDVGGASIPGGAMVMPLFASANRDERHFDDPDRFDIARGNARDHLAFGYGPHFCLGAPLARLEAQVALEQLLTRLPDIRQVDHQVQRLDSFLLRGPKCLPVRFGAASVAVGGASAVGLSGD